LLLPALLLLALLPPALLLPALLLVNWAAPGSLHSTLCAAFTTHATEHIPSFAIATAAPHAVQLPAADVQRLQR
jgi:hypothetical protein